MKHRRRRQAFTEADLNKQEETAADIGPNSKVKICFIEESDYKMEICQQETTSEKPVIILGQEPSQEQRRQAFKKKLLKYSQKTKPEGNDFKNQVNNFRSLLKKNARN